MLKIDIVLAVLYCHGLLADVNPIIPVLHFIPDPSMLLSVHPRSEFSSTLK